MRHDLESPYVEGVPVRDTLYRARRRRQAYADEELRNWYPIKTNVPGRVAIAIAQRGNLAYTRRLLQRHATLWLWLLCGWAVAAIAIALCFEFSLATFLLAVALPSHDFVIVNPPYARAVERPTYETSHCRDLFAYFMERVARQSRGFIAVTPAAYLSAPKFQKLRDVLDRENDGGDVLVFDNVPDTLFRGYKFGSNNTREAGRDSNE